MGLPRKIKNFTLFNEGLSYLGEVDEVTLPKLTRKTEDWRAGGMGGPIKADFGMEGLELEWAPAETRDEKALLEGLVLKKSAVGAVVPDAQLAREAGYTDKELLEFMDEKEEETARKLDAAQAAMGGRISPPGPPSPALTPAPPAPPNGAQRPATTGA